MLFFRVPKCCSVDKPTNITFTCKRTNKARINDNDIMKRLLLTLLIVSLGTLDVNKAQGGATEIVGGDGRSGGFDRNSLRDSYSD